MVTRDEIHLAYRLFLGRDPEAPEVINNLAQTVTSLAQLRDVFLKSPEFVKGFSDANGKPQLGVRQRHPFMLPHIPVETQVSTDQLQQMFDRIMKEWEHLGATEPYWSVITQPKYHQDEFESHRDEFYLSGKFSSDLFLSALRRNGVNPHNLETCLEVGCGVARVTGHLARAFPRVVATDISNQHLQLARDFLASRDIKNVELVHWRSVETLLDLEPVDAIFSVITLQHNPPPVMAWMLERLLEALKPGGVAFIQIPTYRNGYLFEAERYLHSSPPATLEMHYLPQREIFEIVAAANCQCLEIREDAMIGDEEKMLSNSFVIQKKQ